MRCRSRVKHSPKMRSPRPTAVTTAAAALVVAIVLGLFPAAAMGTGRAAPATYGPGSQIPTPRAWPSVTTTASEHGGDDEDDDRARVGSAARRMMLAVAGDEPTVGGSGGGAGGAKRPSKRKVRASSRRPRKKAAVASADRSSDADDSDADPAGVDPADDTSSAVDEPAFAVAETDSLDEASSVASPASATVEEPVGVDATNIAVSADSSGAAVATPPSNATDGDGIDAVANKEGEDVIITDAPAVRQVSAKKSTRMKKANAVASDEAIDLKESGGDVEGKGAPSPSISSEEAIVEEDLGGAVKSGATATADAPVNASSKGKSVATTEPAVEDGIASEEETDESTLEVPEKAPEGVERKKGDMGGQLTEETEDLFATDLATALKKNADEEDAPGPVDDTADEPLAKVAEKKFKETSEEKKSQTSSSSSSNSSPDADDALSKADELGVDIGYGAPAPGPEPSPKFEDEGVGSRAVLDKEKTVKAKKDNVDGDSSETSDDVGDEVDSEVVSFGSGAAETAPGPISSTTAPGENSESEKDLAFETAARLPTVPKRRSGMYKPSGKATKGRKAAVDSEIGDDESEPPTAADASDSTTGPDNDMTDPEPDNDESSNSFGSKATPRPAKKKSTKKSPDATKKPSVEVDTDAKDEKGIDPLGSAEVDDANTEAPDVDADLEEKELEVSGTDPADVVDDYPSDPSPSEDTEAAAVANSDAPKASTSDESHSDEGSDETVTEEEEEETETSRREGEVSAEDVDTDADADADEADASRKSSSEDESEFEAATAAATLEDESPAEGKEEAVDEYADKDGDESAGEVDPSASPKLEWERVDTTDDPVEAATHFEIHISNVGGGELRGRAVPSDAWIKVKHPTFNLKHGKKTILRVRVDEDELDASTHPAKVSLVPDDEGEESVDIPIERPQAGVDLMLSGVSDGKMFMAALAGAVLLGVVVLFYCRDKLMSTWTIPFAGGGSGGDAASTNARSPIKGKGAANWSDAWSDEDDGWDGGENAGLVRKPPVSAGEWAAEEPEWSDDGDDADGWGSMDDEAKAK